MPRAAMGAEALQLFRGGLNKLSLWANHIGGACCDPAPAIRVDRLPPTVNPENANIHTAPFGHRDNWRFSDAADSERQRIVDHINTYGVGAQLEIIVLPTFSLLNTVRVDLHAEEAGLVFQLVTRNGTVLPAGQLIRVTETEGGAGCGEVARVQAVGAFTGIGALGGATRIYNMGVSDQGGEFVLEADVLILEVTAIPASPVVGFFDLQVHATYTAPGRSEATR